MTEKQRKAVAMLAFAIFIVFVCVIGVVVGRPLVALADDPDAFRDWVDSYGIWSRFVYVGVVALQVVVAFIPGEPLELVGGYAFGAVEGTLLALAGIVVGSAAVFGLVRRFGVKMVEVFFTRDKIREMSFLKNPKKTRIIAFLLMFIPGTPKDFLSYFAGLTKLRLGEWLGIVAVARIPSVIGSTISGGAAGSENYVLAAVVWGITLVISALGIGYYRRICKLQQTEEETKNLKMAS